MKTLHPLLIAVAVGALALADGAQATARKPLVLGPLGTVQQLQSGDSLVINSADIAAGLGFTPLEPSNNLSDVANAGTARTNLGLAIGTNVEAWSASLDALGALSTTGKIYYLSAANTWSSVTIGSGLTFSSGSLTASGSGGTVTVTGSPASGELAKFSGASSITNGDLTGDVTTSGGLATTIKSSVALSGSPTATNPTSDIDNTTKIATTEWVQSQLFDGSTFTSGGVDLLMLQAQLWNGTAGWWDAIVNGDATATNNRTLTLDLNDANRTVSLSGNLTVPSAATISGTNTGDQTITLTGAVTGSGTGSFATTLASIGAGDTLCNVTGSSAAPTDQTVSACLDKAFGNAQGDILYRGASAWTVLTPGTSGYFLETLGASANPVWASASGGGGGATPAGSTGNVQTNAGGGNLGAITDTHSVGQVLMQNASGAASFQSLPYAGAQGGAAPAASTFTSWQNQGSLTLTNGTNALMVTGTPSTSNALSLALYTAPSTPFTIYMRSTQNSLGHGGAEGVGIALYNSGNGRIMRFGEPAGIANPGAMVGAWSSATSVANDTYLGNSMSGGPHPWYKLYDDGTTLTWSISSDGWNWSQVATQAISSWIGAVTSVGIYINNNYNAGGFAIQYFGTTAPN